MNSQPSISDRDHLEELLRRIEALGVEVEHRSNVHGRATPSSEDGKHT
jgi:hypothetical protein